MVVIEDKKLCSGCQACENICPVKAIRMKEDTEGFFYPEADPQLCIDCKLCRKICPFLNSTKQERTEKNRDPKFYAVQLKNKSELPETSSGGAFWGIAQQVIEKTGIVYGAKQVNVDYIFHDRATSLEEAKGFQKSKYLQSDMGNCYKRAKKDLINGKTVLFSGTACQIAGLYGYLGKDYTNLFTCEVVCHGVPSRKIWNIYREEKEAIENKIMADLIFRDKSKGWSKNQYCIVYKDGSTEREFSVKQLFHAGYLQGLFYRPSCGNCPFSSIPRIADITLADYWRYKGRLLGKGEDLGVSLAAVNNGHGKQLLDECAYLLNIEPTERTQALESCRHLDGHPAENPERDRFIQEVLVSGYHNTAKKFFRRKSIFERFIHKLKAM